MKSSDDGNGATNGGGNTNNTEGKEGRSASASDALEDAGGESGKPPVPPVVQARLYKNWESRRALISNVSLVEGKRDTWTNEIEFIMTCLSSAVGIGNVWRFPFTAYDNGGGAFLIPFVIVLFGIGAPLYFLETSVGQFATRGPVGIWEMAPICQGVGWAFLLTAAFTAFYYVSILATCTVYLFYGMAAELPWKKCYYDSATKTSEWYATQDRMIFKTLQCVTEANGESHGTYTNQRTGSVVNISNAELFFQYAVARRVDNFEHGLGALDWRMSLAMYFVWFLVFLNTMLGTKTSGKCAYFTALFPFLVLFILFFKAVTLDGSGQGIKYFFAPDWPKLFTMEVWFKAIGQSFFSLGVGYGVITTYGSYNPFRQSIYRNVIFITIMDAFTSVLAGVTVFAIIGVLAHRKNIKLTEVTTGGNGLAFVTYPEIVVEFEKDGPGAAQTFSAFFFIMLLTLGIGSGSSYVIALCGNAYDRIPFIGKRKSLRVAFTAGLCLFMATAGLIFATAGGNYMVDFFDTFSSGFVVYAIIVFKLIGIAYIYGAKNISRDLQFVFSPLSHDKTPLLYTLFEIWAYVVPLSLFLAFVFVLSQVQPLTTQDGQNFPIYLQALGWLLVSLIVLIVPIVAVLIYCTRKSTNRYHKLMACFKPSHKWGPKIPEDKAEWVEWKRNYDGDTLLWKITFGKWCKNKEMETGNPLDVPEAPALAAQDGDGDVVDLVDVNLKREEDVVGGGGADTDTGGGGM